MCDQLRSQVQDKVAGARSEQAPAGQFQRSAYFARFAAGIAILLIAAISGCNGGGNPFTSGGGSTGPTAANPSVTSVSPMSGAPGTPVIITGTGFSTQQLSPINGTVTINNTQAPVIFWSNTEIIAEVPQGASSGNVVVQGSGNSSTQTVNFTVPAPATPPVSTCTTNAAEQALFTGSYAYVMSGFKGTGQVGTHFVRAGSVTIVSGAITGGEEDLNVAGNVDDHHTITSAGSSFCIGADNRGTLTLAYNDSPPTATFRIAIGTVVSGAATRVHVIEFDDTNGTGMRASGEMVQQTTGITLPTPANWTFGFQGIDSSHGHVSLAGTFLMTADSVSGGTMDEDDAGTVDGQFSGTNTNGATTGSLIPSGTFSTTGRGILQLTGEPACGANCTWHFAEYFISTTQAFVVSTDTLGTFTPVVSGRVIDTTTGFSNSSLLIGNCATGEGCYLMYGSGSIASVAQAEVGALQFVTNYSSTMFSYPGANATTPFTNSGTFTVSSQGRVTFTSGSAPATDYIIYLANLSQAIMGNNDTIAGFGIDESTNAAVGLVLLAQEDAILDTTTSPAAYAFGTVLMGDAAVVNRSGEAGVEAIVSNNVPGGAANISAAVDQSSQTSPYLLSSTYFGTAFSFNFTGGLGEITSTLDGSTGCSGGPCPIVGWADGTAVISIDENGAASVTIAAQ